MEAPDFVEKSLEADNAGDGSRDATKDKYMTWNERRVYRYYLAIGQEDRAEEYYGALDKLELKSRKAAEDAEDWDKAGFLGHLAFGAYSGTAGALKSTGVGLLGFIPAAEDLVGELTADPLQSELQQQAMQELGDGVEKFFGQVGGAVGSIAPVLAANLIAPGSGVGAVFLQSYGAGIQQGLRSGASDSDARLYGFLNAAVNTAAWGLGARLGGSGGGYLSRALENQAGRLVSSLAKSGTVRAALGAVAKPVTTGIANGLENYTTVLADQVMRNMILNESNPVNPFSAEAMNAFGVAAVTGILYSIPEVPGTYREAKMGSALLETPGGVSGILDAAKQLEVGRFRGLDLKQAIRQAESNPNVYNIGNLANIVAPGMRAYLLTEAGKGADESSVAANRLAEEQLGGKVKVEQLGKSGIIDAEDFVDVTAEENAIGRMNSIGLSDGGVARTGIGTTGEGIPVEKVNPKVLDEIYPDQSGAYGYLPKEGTPYAKYDFTDIEKTGNNRAIRMEYIKQSQIIQEAIDEMRINGNSLQQIAKKVVDIRNFDKINARAKMPPEDLAPIEQRNIEIYGNPIGPDAQWLFKVRKKEFPDMSDEEIWSLIIKSSMRKDEVLNTLLGIKY